MNGSFVTVTPIRADSGPRPEAWLLGEARAARGQLIATVGWALGAGVLIVLQARLLALVCQHLVMERTGLGPLLPLAFGVAVVAMLRGVLLLFSERHAVSFAARIKQRVRELLYAKLQELGPAGLTGEETAPLVEAVTSGVEGLEPYFARFLPHVALALLLPPLALAVVFPAEWRSGLVLLFSAPFIPLFMILIGRGSESLNRRQWGRLSRMAGYLLDRVQGLPDLKIFGAAKAEAALVAQISDKYRQGTMAILRIAFLSAFTLEFFATVGTAVVAVVVGFRLLEGRLTLVDGLFVLLLAPEFYLPLRTLGLSYHSRMQGIAAAERIAPLLELSLPQGYAGQFPAPLTAPSIVFEGVSFRYGDDRGGISGIDLELPSGSLTALVGESGVGKTTLARLLVGLSRPEKGRITINGVDLAQLSPESWRASLAWVSQRPFFFKGTIAENLLLGCPQKGEQEIRSALDAAAATAFIARLPAGLDTELGDGGAGLSGGELRRLALARAFLRDVVIVVLDEPTAGLDIENERLIGEALQRLAIGRTVLLISHREGTQVWAQRVAVMSGGRLERIVSATEYLASTAGKP